MSNITWNTRFFWNVLLFFCSGLISSFVFGLSCSAFYCFRIQIPIGSLLLLEQENFSCFTFFLPKKKHKTYQLLHTDCFPKWLTIQDKIYWCQTESHLMKIEIWKILPQSWNDLLVYFLDYQFLRTSVARREERAQYLIGRAVPCFPPFPPFFLLFPLMSLLRGKSVHQIGQRT